LARSGAVSSGMGVGMPEAKRLEKLRIWRPGAVSRGGVAHVAREIRGAGRGGAAEFQVSSFSESGHSDFRIRGLLCAQLRHSALTK
jgi:hypothetical protein